MVLGCRNTSSGLPNLVYSTSITRLVGSMSATHKRQARRAPTDGRKQANIIQQINAL